MKKLCCLLSLSFLFINLPAEPVFSAGDAIKAKGTAAIKHGFLAAARDKAIEDARLRAVKLALGKLISSGTVINKYTIIRNNFLLKKDDYIKEFSIEKESVYSDTFIVIISAQIKTGAVKKKLRELGLIK